MSKKYYDRLLVGTGSTTKEVQSKFGEKLMAKMGWKKGDGLGKNMNGIIDCVQIKRRDENEGLGAEIETPSQKFKWNDSFWDDAYNQMAAKFSAAAPKTNGKKKVVDSDDTFDEMIQIGSNADSDSDDSSIASFDGDLVITQSKKPLMTLEKKKKETSSTKLDKSKAIKKDKKKSKK